MRRKLEISRRQIFSASALIGSTVLIDRVNARAISGEVPWEPGEANTPAPINHAPAHFFTPEEGEFHRRRGVAAHS